MEFDTETENFNNFINNIVHKQNGGGIWDFLGFNENSETEIESEGGAIWNKLTKKKVIFFPASSINNWKIFTIDGKPIESESDLKSFATSKMMFVNKNDLYKQINNKGYSCFNNEKTATLINLTSEKIKEINKNISTEITKSSDKIKNIGKDISSGITKSSDKLKDISKDISSGIAKSPERIKEIAENMGKDIQGKVIDQKDIILLDTTFSNYKMLGQDTRAKLINKVVKDILDTKREAQPDYYKKLLKNLNDLIVKIEEQKQTGGDIATIDDNFGIFGYDSDNMNGGSFASIFGNEDNENGEDNEYNELLNLLTGGTNMPKSIDIGDAFKTKNTDKKDSTLHFIEQCKNALRKINTKLDPRFICDSCLVIDESITGKSKVLNFIKN